jgi:hypothetical protein
MISVQLGVSLAEALLRLPARAYAQDRPVADVAADVVGRWCASMTARPGFQREFTMTATDVQAASAP